MVQGVSAAGFKIVSKVQIKCKAQCLQHLVSARLFQHFTNKVCLVQDFQHKATQHEPEQEYIPDDFKKMKNSMVSKDEAMTNQIG